MRAPLWTLWKLEPTRPRLQAHPVLATDLAGARITGVDDETYSSTGESFSAIVLPNSESNATKKLQADDVSLAYEFSKKVTYLPALLPFGAINMYTTGFLTGFPIVCASLFVSTVPGLH